MPAVSNFQGNSLGRQVRYLDIIREHNGSQCCEGRMFLDGELLGFTLELPVRTNRRRLDAIPAGDYPVELVQMPSRPSWGLLPLILDVPGRSGIWIHPGNHAGHFHGCIGLGLVRGRERIGESVRACAQLVKELQGCFITLSIKENF